MKNASLWIGAMALSFLTGCGAGPMPGASEQPAYSLATPFQPRYTDRLSTRARWPTRVIRVAFAQGAETHPLSELRTAMENQIRRWTVATGGLVTFSFTDEPADAEVHVTFVDPGDPDIPSGSGEQAVTKLEWFRSNPRDTISRAQIKILTGLTGRQVASIAAHEMGHALGITGHSDNRGDLMAPQISTGTPVSLRDASTIAFLYLSDDRD